MIFLKYLLFQVVPSPVTNAKESSGGFLDIKPEP